MKKSLLATLAAAALLVAAAPVTTYAQDEFTPQQTQAAPAQPKHSTFYDVLFGSGWLGTLLWLVCDEASGFVTGSTIAVDGGFAAYSGV